jgi:tRNA G46 methylase TrmB
MFRNRAIDAGKGTSTANMAEPNPETVLSAMKIHQAGRLSLHLRPSHTEL